MNILNKKLYIAISLLFYIVAFSCLSLTDVQAAEIPRDQTSKVGVHLLQPNELPEAKKLVTTPQTQDKWQYMTIPYTLADIDKGQDWQQFFDEAEKQKIIPILRLTTKFEDDSWQVPTRWEITQLVDSLARLDWPTDQKHIIVFNEVNHAKEWGGRLDPAEYGRLLRFTADWAHSEDVEFVVLPAAMDLAAPNGAETKEAFAYLTAMSLAEPEVFEKIDAWNSHSYPNPGFSSSPLRSGQNSLRGFEYELDFLSEKTDTDLEVYITETGWEDNGATNRWLTNYYEYALQHIWSNDRVVAVTPFIFKGDPGPFSRFSFVSGSDEPTHQYYSLQSALRRVYEEDAFVASAGIADLDY